MLHLTRQGSEKVMMFKTEKGKYSVIGAGCGGLVIAEHLASKGYNVSLYNRSSNRIKSFRQKGYNVVYGDRTKNVRLSYIGTDISSAISNRDIIIVVITANGHKEIAEKMAPYLKDGQIILLVPGRTCGALEFEYTLKQSGCDADVIIAEANTLFFVARIETPNTITVKGMKKTITVSALHSADTEYVLDKIHNDFPQLIKATSFLETSFGNIGAIFHPVIFLINKERILAGESFNFYTEGVTNKVAYFIEEVDHEVQNIATAMNTSVLSVKDWLKSRYGLKYTDIYTMIRSNPVYKDIKAPVIIDHRYLREDIPTGLVPLSSFGKILGVSTKTIDYFIDEGCELLKKDFRKEGRTLENLGLSKNNLLFDLDEIINKKTKKIRIQI